MEKLKVIFMGTPIFSLPILEALYNTYDVILVVTQPDKPSNRGKVIFSPIKDFAVNHNIEVFQPEKMKNDYETITKLKPDLIVTCAYGQIVPTEVLNCTKYGCINVHASLLPKYRGGAPIHRAIMEGEEETGITIMTMVDKMDAGDIISQSKIPILKDDTVSIIHDKLSILGRDLLMETIPSIIDKTCTYKKQNEDEVSFAWTIKKEDEHIDFNKSTKEIINKIRGLNSFPGAFALLDSKVIKIYSAKEQANTNDNAKPGQITKLYDDGIGIKTSDGEIIITELKIEGKKKMNAKDYINGIVNKDSLVGKVFE